MMKMIFSLALAWCCVGASVSCLVLASQATSPGGHGTIGSPPPRALACGERRPAIFEVGYPDVSGRATYSLSKKVVRIQWRRKVNGHVYYSNQDIPTGFWPTEVCAERYGGLYVAGKQALDGNTIIQLWKFLDVQPLPAPYTDPQGNTIYPPLNLPVTSKVLVYSADEPGRRLVRFMFPNLGSGGQSLFVNFFDSKDLYEVTLDGTITKRVAALPDPLGGCPVVGELSDERYDNRMAAEHGTLGYIYMMGMNAPDDSGVWGVVFRDVDKDGALDVDDTLLLSSPEDVETYTLSTDLVDVW